MTQCRDKNLTSVDSRVGGEKLEIVGTSRLFFQRFLLKGEGRK